MKRGVYWKRIIGVALLVLLLIGLGTFLTPSAERTYYRVDHLDLILQASQRHEVSPYLVGAVIFTESRFRSEARSEVGAVGLMQLMPETAEEVADRLGMADVTSASLEEPKVNIELGVAYLKELQERFPDESLALAAYNAGPTVVAQWASEGRAVPYAETREFVTSVRYHRDRLSELYPEWSRTQQ